MAGQAPTTWRELEAEPTRRAWQDEAFRRALVADPRGTLERELGVRVPEGASLTVREESPTTRYVILPARPPSDPEALSDAELEAAGGGVFSPTDMAHCTWCR
jgi:hypothetical protein